MKISPGIGRAALSLSILRTGLLLLIIFSFKSVFAEPNPKKDATVIFEAPQSADIIKRNAFVITGAFISLLALTYVQYRKQQKLVSLINRQSIELASVNNIKSKLFSIIGHDLRGPMSSISASFYLLENNMLDLPSQKKLFRQLKNLHRSSYDTLTKLLYWGSAQLKVGAITRIIFDPLEQLMSNFSIISEPALAKEIVLDVRIPKGLQIHADANHFEFILTNILHNAIKFTDRGGSVIVDIASQTADAVTISVADNGLGIAEDKLAKLFSGDYITTKGTDNEQGPGLGLMLCMKFIKENNGSIQVESKPGEGSTFFISLPVKTQF